jgi:pyrroloquinoline quinone biosynthesis protein D
VNYVGPAIADDANGMRPSVSHGFRLQWESAQDAHVLLYPEGMVRLNASAAAILSRCDGERTVAQIIADLERSYGVSGLEGDVRAFLTMAIAKAWVVRR